MPSRRPFATVGAALYWNSGLVQASLPHRAVRTVLEPNGVYLVCDHVVGPEGMTNTELYMTSGEQQEALHAAGFGEVKILLEKKGLALHRAIQAT